MKTKKLSPAFIFIIGVLLAQGDVNAQPLSVRVTAINSCGSSNGAIYLNIQGEPPPYSIFLDGHYVGNASGNTYTITSLPATSFAVMVTDDYGDTANRNVSIEQEPAIYITYAIVHHGGCQDTVYVSPSGGTRPYSYSWPPGGYGDSIQPICSDQSETLTITDPSEGCVVTFTITDTNPSFNYYEAVLKSPCTGGCDGKAVVMGTTGVPPYSYTWQTTPSQHTDTAINLCPGIYEVDIVDSVNVTATATVAILEPSPLAVSVDYITYGNCNDSAIGVVSGGAAPYLYKWNNNPASSNDSFGNICKDEHDTLTVTDGSGCFGAVVYYAIDSELLQSPGCYSFSNYIVPPDSQQQAFYYYGDGNPGFLQDWHVSNGTPSIQPGEQSILPYDGAAQFALIGVSGTSGPSCSEGLELAYNFEQGRSYKVSLAVITLDINGGPNPLDIRFILLHDTINYVYGSYSGGCSPTPDIPAGSLIVDSLIGYEDTAWKVISFNINNLDSSYSQLWIREELSQNAQILTTFFCFDSMCVLPIFNTAPSTLSANATIVNTITCNGYCNGSATVAVTGGIPPYTYAWSTSPKQTTDTATNLCSTTYTVMVYDSLHDSTTAMVIFSQPALISDSVQKTICYGQSYQGHYSAGIYTDTLTAQSGCDSIVTLTLAVNPALTGINKLHICLGDTFEGHTTGGTYYDTIRASGGCDSIVTLELQIDTLPNVIPIRQNGDTLFTLSGYQVYDWYQDSAKLLYSGADSFYVITHSASYYVTISNNPQFCVKSSAVIVAYATGLEHLAPGTQHITVNPNPNNGNFTISITGNYVPGASLSIYDMLGREVYRTEPTTGNINVQLNESGMYLIRYSNGDNSVVRKVVVE